MTLLFGATVVVYGVALLAHSHPASSLARFGITNDVALMIGEVVMAHAGFSSLEMDISMSATEMTAHDANNFA